jgi:UDP-2-acetamido-2,6-beta-L-arabino-hexul-4-ose reductase
MKTVLVTGAGGFLGKNLVVALGRLAEVRVLTFDRSNDPSDLDAFAREADVVYHLAGVNRPENPADFETENVGLTRRLTDCLRQRSGGIPIVLSSSTQAELDNPYGISKRRAEQVVCDYGAERGSPAVVFRLPGIFGKWCRPNYNSVVATFCHNIARGLEIHVSDPHRELELVYVDDVVAAFLHVLDPRWAPQGTPIVRPTFRVTLGDLAGRVRQLADIRRTLVLPDLADEFTRRLQVTFLSYLPPDDFAYTPEAKTDARGTLVELLKSRHAGQVFVSRSHPGVIRGRHYHDGKVEKFCVIDGTAAIRFRHVLTGDLLTYNVSGAKLQIVDIPPGYSHSIENLGPGELIVLFWASEIFDPARPDTHARSV